MDDLVIHKDCMDKPDCDPYTVTRTVRADFHDFEKRGAHVKPPLLVRYLNRGRDARVLPQEKTSAKVIPPRLETQRFFPPK